MSFLSMSVIINSEKEKAKKKNLTSLIFSLILLGVGHYLIKKFGILAHVSMPNFFNYLYLLILPFFLLKSLRISENSINSDLNDIDKIIVKYSKYRDLNSYSENDKKIFIFMEKYFFKYNIYFESNFIFIILIMPNANLLLTLYIILYFFYNFKINSIEKFLSLNSTKLGIFYDKDTKEEEKKSLELSYVNLEEFGYKEFQCYNSVVIKKNFIGIARNLLMILQIIVIYCGINLTFFYFPDDEFFSFEILTNPVGYVMILFHLLSLVPLLYLSYLNTLKIEIFSDRIFVIRYPFTFNFKGKTLYKSKIKRFYFECKKLQKGNLGGSYVVYCLYNNNKSVTIYNGIFKEEEASDLCKKLNNELV